METLQKRKSEKNRATHIFINYPRYISRHNRFSFETLSLSSVIVILSLSRHSLASFPLLDLLEVFGRKRNGFTGETGTTSSYMFRLYVCVCIYIICLSVVKNNFSHMSHISFSFITLNEMFLMCQRGDGKKKKKQPK
jgi:hypothetical protein